MIPLSTSDNTTSQKYKINSKAMSDSPLATALNCWIIFYFSCFQTYVVIVSALIGMLYYVPKWNLNFIWYLNAGFIGFVCYSIIELSSGYWADRCKSKVITVIFNLTYVPFFSNLYFQISLAVGQAETIRTRWIFSEMYCMYFSL
jgi:hypothetical protein